MLQAARQAASRSRIELPKLARAFSSGSRVVELQTDAEFNKAMSQPDRLKVLDYTASWCPPCKMIRPVYEQLSVSHPEAEASPLGCCKECPKQSSELAWSDFYTLDIDNEALVETVLHAQIASVPTFAFWRNGRELASFSGADKQQLEQKLHELST